MFDIPHCYSLSDGGEGGYVESKLLLWKTGGAGGFGKLPLISETNILSNILLKK
mgnify:CR=1 FL=1